MLTSFANQMGRTVGPDLRAGRQYFSPRIQDLTVKVGRLGDATLPDPAELEGIRAESSVIA
jgi:hypothetical protein